MTRTIVITVVVGLFACAGRADVHARHARVRDPEWIAPPEASSRDNPLSSRPETSEGGRKLFAQRCSACHRTDGRGSDRAPDLTVSGTQMQSDGALFWKISGGNTRTGMPAFSFLPELQRWQLVMYLRQLGRNP